MFQFFKNQIISLGISYLISFADKIKFEPLRTYIQYLGAEVQQVVTVITDGDKNDKAQLMKIWATDKNNFVASTIATTAAFVDTEIKDERVKFVVKNVLRDLEKVLTTGVIAPGSNLESYLLKGKFEVKGPNDILL